MTSGHQHPRHVRRVYAASLGLAVILFSFHTWVLFEMAIPLHRCVIPIMRTFGPHTGGPLLILASFIILFVSHLAEGAAWALFFWKMREFSTFSEGMYFAGTSLTALGYGDVVLRPPWRGLGPIMATNGILMYGCSTAFLFLVIQKIWSAMELLPIPSVR